MDLEIVSSGTSGQGCSVLLSILHLMLFDTDNLCIYQQKTPLLNNLPCCNIYIYIIKLPTKLLYLHWQGAKVFDEKFCFLQFLHPPSNCFQEVVVLPLPNTNGIARSKLVADCGSVLFFFLWNYDLFITLEAVRAAVLSSPVKWPSLVKECIKQSHFVTAVIKAHFLPACSKVFIQCFYAKICHAQYPLQSNKGCTFRHRCLH